MKLKGRNLIKNRCDKIMNNEIYKIENIEKTPIFEGYSSTTIYGGKEYFCKRIDSCSIEIVSKFPINENSIKPNNKEYYSTKIGVDEITGFYKFYLKAEYKGNIYSVIDINWQQKISTLTIRDTHFKEDMELGFEYSSFDNQYILEVPNEELSFYCEKINRYLDIEYQLELYKKRRNSV